MQQTECWPQFLSLIFFLFFFPVKYHTSKYTSRGFETLRDLTRCPVNSETPLIVSSFSSKLWPHQHDCTTHRSIACARTIRSQDRVISSKTLAGQRGPIVAELLWSSLDHSVVDDKYQRHGSIVENRVLFYYEDVLSVVWEITWRWKRRSIKWSSYLHNLLILLRCDLYM